MEIVFNSPLYGECKILIDDDIGQELLKVYKIYAKKQTSGGFYAIAYRTENGKQVHHLLHRLILRPKSGQQIDHINGNGLDNRRENLRYATASQNAQNRKGWGKLPKGVKLNKYSGKYEARFQMHKRYYHLGSFNTPEEASLAYQTKAKEYFGEFYRNGDKK